VLSPIPGDIRGGAVAVGLRVNLPKDRRARLWPRVVLILLLFVPAPIAAAHPGFAFWLTADWAGLPAASWIGTAYLLLFVGLTMSFSRVAGDAATGVEG
jgi:hypothetical protein